MEIKCKLIKELEDGSAIITIEMDEEAKEFFIGEGFLTVLKRSLESSQSYVKRMIYKSYINRLYVTNML